MDKKALFNLTYGLFVLTSKCETKASGCIIDTCIQVADNPIRLAISCANGSCTCGVVKRCGVFALNILDESCTFPTICHFGYQSGREVDKFHDVKILTDLNGVPYLIEETCAVISCRVEDSKNLGSHTLFIGEVVDAMLLSSKKPLSYAEYLARIKPAAEVITPC